MMDDELLAGPTLLERARRTLEVPLSAALGLELLDAADPGAGLALSVDGIADTGLGGAHASAVAAAMEAAGYLALQPQLRLSEHAVTHAVTLSLIGAAPPGARVEVRGEVDRRTRRLAFVSVVARVDGTVVARAQMVKSIVPYVAPSPGG